MYPKQQIVSSFELLPHTIAVYASWAPSPAGHATLATGRVLALTRTGLAPAGSDQLTPTHPPGLRRFPSRTSNGLHWRLWNGKAKDAQICIDRIRAVMHHIQGETIARHSG
jgi:hypothetical protein